MDAVTNGVVSNGIVVRDARREARLQLVHAGLDHGLLDRQRVGAGAQVDQRGRGRLAVEPAREVVAARAEHRLADVAHPDERAVGPGAHDDVVELLRRLQPAERGDRERELRCPAATARRRAGRRGWWRSAPAPRRRRRSR